MKFYVKHRQFRFFYDITSTSTISSRSLHFHIPQSTILILDTFEIISSTTTQNHKKKKRFLTKIFTQQYRNRNKINKRMVKNEMGGGNASSQGKFRRERTREKFRRLKFQPVPPSSHNRDLRKLLRGRWREVRSKENRESSTAKRDFHPFYLLFFPLPFLLFSSLFFFFFFFLHPLRDEIESPFRTHHRFRLRHPFSITGRERGGGKKGRGEGKL